jgi:flagellar biosynthesis GTPase FlhF
VVLGLLWRLILKWQNVLHETRGEVGEQAESVAKSTKDAKAKLLDWIRNKVGNYQVKAFVLFLVLCLVPLSYILQHVRITNDFAESFDNGMALCALVHAFDPKLVAYEMLDPNRKLDNLALGMHLAEQYLGVARMLDPADVAEADDKAMMVYLYEFPKAFLARVQVTDGENGEEARNRIAEEAKRRQMEDDEARRRAEEEARRRAEEEARRRMEEDARRRMEEDARRRMEEDARRQDEARWRAEEEARRRAEEEARRRADEEEMRRRAAEQERLRLFQQYQTPIVVAAPPQIHTVVIKESSNIGRLSVDVIQVFICFFSFPFF